MELDENGRLLFVLMSGEKFLLPDLDKGTSYEVTQNPGVYYEQRDSGNTSGTLEEDTTVDFINYKPIVINGVKTVEGEEPKAYEQGQFTFTLKAEDQTHETTNGDDGAFCFTYAPANWEKLPDDITVTETGLHEAYEPVDGEAVVVLNTLVDENGILQVSADTVTMDNKLKTIDVQLKKVWEGYVGEQVELTVIGMLSGDTEALRRQIVLKPDMEDVKVETGATSVTWTYTLADQPRYARTDDGLVFYSWYLDENVTGGMEPEFEREVDEDTGNVTLTVTNHLPTLTICKVWADGEAPVDSLTVRFSRRHESMAFAIAHDVEITAADDWTYSCELKPEEVGFTDESGNYCLYTYSVSEPDLPAGYTSVVEGEGYDFTVTNYQKPACIVKKVWEDDDNARGIRPDSVSVQLNKDGEPVGDPLVLNEENGWTAVCTGLDEGAEYTVTEAPVPGYTATVTKEGMTFTVTNTCDDSPVLKIIKIWEDDDNSGSARPDSITVDVLRVGIAHPDQKQWLVIEAVELTAADHAVEGDSNRWIYSVVLDNANDFFCLDYADEDGDRQLYQYHALEVKIPEGYTAFEFTNGYELTLTNELTTTPEIKITKVWEDNGNSAGTRPDSITFGVIRSTSGT